MMISILLLLATLIQGTSMVTDKAWTCVMPAEANLSNPLFVPLSTRVLKSEVLPFDLTLFNQTPTSSTDVEPQLIVETADLHFFFVALSAAAAITAVIVAAVLLIFMLFMFAAFLFTKKNQKPRKSTKQNKREKSCGTCCDCCFIYLWPEQLQVVSSSAVEQVSPVVVVEEVLVEVEALTEVEEVLPEVEAPTEITFIAPPLLTQQQQTTLQLQYDPLSPSQQQQQTLLQHAPPSPSQPQQTSLQSLQATLPPTQQQQIPLQLQQDPPLPCQQQHSLPQQPRRSSRLAGKPPVDFRPFF